MRTAAFDYELPQELIAQEPAAHRAQSRLLRVPRGGGEPSEHRFVDLPDLLHPGDLLLMNDARVAPARLWVQRPTGAEVELLLLDRLAPDKGSGESWLALAGPARKARVGEELLLFADPRSRGAVEGAREIRIRVVEARERGQRLLRFPPGCDVDDLLETRGAMPLPPYIHRQPGDPRSELDRRRYQTVYAERAGSVAAPTAGLHFTAGLLDALQQRGIGQAMLTLDVGPGTFQPIRSERVEDHRMLPERYRIPSGTAEAISETRRRGGRIVAVGTTVVRALEHAASGAGGLAPGAGEADLFITPGFEFRVVDSMVTNFHLPRSTPILMVAALVGRERLLDAYRLAVERRFRFYSYGDAMLVS